MHATIRWRRRAAALGLALGLCFAATSARAQGWLEDRDRAEGAGFRVGDLELHPGLGAEVGYDSNVYLSENPASSGILRLTPHLLLSTMGAERRGEGGEQRRGSPPAIAFRGGLSASLYSYLATQAITDVGGDLDLSLTINPERPFSVTLTENFGRTIRPFTEAGAARGNYNRDQNTAGVQLDFGTKGRIFSGRLGYELGVDIFEGGSFGYAGSLTHHLQLGTSWRFLPNTAFVYDFDLSAVTYPDTSGATVLLSRQQRLRSRIGINGAFTNKFSLLALVGYGAGFYSVGDEYDSVVGQVELRFKMSPGSRFAVGYDRDFFTSLVGGFYRRDRGYLNLQVLLGGSFMLGVEGSVGLYDFGAALDPAGGGLGAGGETQRADVRATASLFGEYRATDWLAFNTTLRYTGDFTDFQYQRNLGPGGIVPDPADYQRFQAWGGVRVFY